MTQDKRALLGQIFSRLCFHTSLTPEQMEHKRECFIRRLLHYPEDLICAAYHYMQHRLTPYRLPSEEEFIRFMLPEYERRLSVIPSEAEGSCHAGKDPSTALRFGRDDKVREDA